MRSARSLDPGIIYPKPNARASVRLFCFPYAGGGVTTYRSWADYLPAHVELGCLQYPGRGSRLSKSPFTRLMPLVDELLPTLLPLLDKPFAFFGHSMGAIIAFELARKLEQRSESRLRHLFVSGRQAPQIPVPDEHTYDLPEPEFVEELRRLKGTPPEALSHPELMELMLPLLRADFEAIQTYAYVPAPPLHCPITAFGGSMDEDVSREDVEAWGEQTTGPFTARMFAGDHFFLHSSEAHLVQDLARELVEFKPRPRPPSDFSW